ncbi:MAG: GNAT family N-acetyltransferase [Promethearchaeota archaeon]|nr:MAG: GNAT family N-acetyltransferase [Candidatus Lokiarchaeota archaeon]
MSNLHVLSKIQIKKASHVISEAFFNDPLMTYLFPEIKERKFKLSSMMELLIRIGMKYGVVQATSPHIEGIAVWFPSNKAKITPTMGFLNGGISYFFKLRGKTIKKQNKIYNYIYSKHKELMPSDHWYLSIIGINPLFQGKGWSTLLLNSMFTQIDKQNLPYYLDTNNKENISIYERFGFEIVEEYKLPNANLVNWAMIREI